MRELVRIFFLCLVLLAVLNGFAQRKLIFNKELINDPQTKFINLNTSNGLSNDNVTSVLQDKYGMMWATTLNGINSFNGMEFVNYFHNPKDSLSPQSSLVTCVEENKNGHLFFGTDKGLCLFNRENRNFKRIVLIGSGYSNSSSYVRKIKSDGKNKLWVEVLEGALLLYDIEKDSVVLNISHQGTHQPYYYYHSIYYDSDSVLWIGGRGMNPMFLDSQKKRLISIPNHFTDHNKKRENDVASYFEDSKGNFWVTALDGIYLLDRETKIFTKFLRTSTWDVHEDLENIMWFATGSGVMKYDPESEEITLFTKQKDNPFSLASNSVYDVYEDFHGNLWFSTNSGISIYSPTAYPFGSFSHIPGIDNSPGGTVVKAAVEDEKGNLWIGYEEEGLDYFDTYNESFIHFKKKKNALAANEISNLYLDNHHRLWISLWRGIGFNIYNTKLKKFELFSFDANTSKFDWYNDFVEDNKGNFYVGFWGNEGLTPFDIKSGSFLKTLKNKFPRVQVSRLITRMLKDINGNIWFGTTRGGLHVYCPETDTSRSYFADVENNRGLLSNGNEDICQDLDDNIWLIGKTLQRYLPENDTFLSYGSDNGLTSSNLVSLLPDNIGNIWVASSDKGLFRFNVEDQVFTRFSKDDGLSSNKFSKGRTILSTGDLLFGSTNGFNLFSPGHIINQSVLPKPFFGNLLVNDVRINIDLNMIPDFVFSSDEKIIKLELTSSDVVNPERYLYQCKLIGYDNDWINVNAKTREIRYSHIPAGRYEFQYRIGDGQRWSSKIAVANFRFTKSFFKSWWFFFIVIFVVLIITIAIIKQRIFDLNQKHKNLELQQKLFRLQMNPHFMFNSLLAIQNFVFQKNVKEAGIYISDFARLFRLILDNSRNEFVVFKKEVETLEFYLKLQALRYEDKFTYNIVMDENIETDILMIPPMLAQPIIENAIEHGIFNKPTKGEIIISYKKINNTIKFEVQDDGIGFLNGSKNKKSNDHKSSALEITRERLKVLSKKHNFHVIFEIKTIKNQIGEIVGTKVSFHLPYKYRGE
jgi:ligand-binding sensor domain-containing protein